MRRLWYASLGLALAPALARAEAESAAPGAGAAAAPVTNRVNLRIGGSTTDDTGNPTICVDVAIAGGFGVETCGTGQAIIHDDVGREMAHFRATYTFFDRATRRGTGKLRAGLGFAELQVGVDHPGFSFGEPDRVDRGSAAGPEAALQGQWLVPLAGGVEAVASFTAGVAAFAGADQLIEPQSTLQPFAAIEIGIGF